MTGLKWAGSQPKWFKTSHCLSMNTHGSCSDPLLKGVIASMIRINQSPKKNNG